MTCTSGFGQKLLDDIALESFNRELQEFDLIVESTTPADFERNRGRLLRWKFAIKAEQN